MFVRLFSFVIPMFEFSVVITADGVPSNAKPNIYQVKKGKDIGSYFFIMVFNNKKTYLVSTSHENEK